MAIAKTYPEIYMPMARLKYPGSDTLAPGRVLEPGVSAPNGRVADDTEIVIEGFPRSGNTFSVYAFALAQGKPVRMAHHLHAPAQLIVAARQGIPAVLVIREPEGAVLSRAAARVTRPVPASADLKRILRGYVRFHAALIPFASVLVIAPFPIVTSDFGAIVDRVNERYGTSYQRFDHTAENVQKVFAWIDEGGRRARPAEQRTEAKAQLLAEFRSPDLARLRSSAETLYADFLSRVSD